MLLANKSKNVDSTCLATDARTNAKGETIWPTSRYRDLVGTQLNLRKGKFLIVFGAYFRGGAVLEILAGRHPLRDARRENLLPVGCRL